jgi:thioredoxin 1
MKGILDPMIADYSGKVDVRIIDVYKEKDLAREYKIVTIPTQVFIDASGTELYRHVGVYPRDSMEACFARFGFPVVTGSPAPTPASGGT